jgi:hypothetical protein
VSRPLSSAGVIDEDAIGNLALIADLSKLLQTKAARGAGVGAAGLMASPLANGAHGGGASLHLQANGLGGKKRGRVCVWSWCLLRRGSRGVAWGRLLRRGRRGTGRGWVGGRCAYTCKVSVRHCAIGAVLHAPTPGKPCASNAGGGLASPEQWSPGFLWVLRDFNLSIVNEVRALPLLRGFVCVLRSLLSPVPRPAWCLVLLALPWSSLRMYVSCE